MRKLAIVLSFVLLPFISSGQIHTTIDGNDLDFPTLNEAFNFVNSYGFDVGDVVMHVTGNTVESDSVILQPSGWDFMSYYSSITVYPDSPGLKIEGDIDGPIIFINGAANLIIDGRVGGTGSTASLTLSNLSTGNNASTIRFCESANNNIIRYCNINGAGSRANRGTVFFSTASSGSGNSNNQISNNIISGQGTSRAANAVLSIGSPGYSNTGNTISANSFKDHMRFSNPADGAVCSGILISSNNSGWTISGNSFYEANASFIPASGCTYNFIYVSNSGTGYNINGNYIGGQAASCGGSAWTKTGANNNIFYGIRLSSGAGPSSAITNNYIQNITWTNSSNANWTGIDVASGDANIGTNQIGSSTVSGPINYSAGTTSGNLFAINISSTGTVTCQNNIIGTITAANAAAGATHFYGITKTGVAGTTNINNNTIGSTINPNSINASSAGTQNVVGINNSGTGSITINGNTIANMNNACSNATANSSRIDGIYSINGTNTISGNTIFNLTIGSNNIGASPTASIAGIALGGNTLKTVTLNTIYGLNNTHPGFKGYVYGILFSGNTGANDISRNFIYGLSVNSNSSDNFIIGLRLVSGAVTMANNIISVGGDTRTTVYGIYDGGVSPNNSTLYFNTVYVSGSVPTGTWKSAALYVATATSTRIYQNNIFYNIRSTSGGSGSLHFAANYVATGNVNSNYNAYWVSGTGGMLGYYGGDKSNVPVVTGFDANSLNVNASFSTPGGSAATDYKLTATIPGGPGTGINTDFGGNTRDALAPTPGAWEYSLNKWIGTTSTAWNLAGNWTGNSVPPENSDLIFDNAAVNDCYLNADHSVKNITNSTSRKLVANGHQLTVTGDLTFTGGAQIDASAASSTLVLAGTSAQTIVSANYSGGSVYNLIAANAAGITLNNDFTVTNTLTINAGRSLVVSAPNLLTVSGTITNNAGASGLILRSTANGVDAKLINNTDLVSATVELYLSGGNGTYGPRYHYIVPPVQTFGIDNSSVAATRASLGLTSFYGDLLLFDETKATTSKNAGWQYFDGWNSTTGFNVLNSTRGYNIHLPANDRITFTGQLNAIQHTYSLSYTGTIGYPGWNLVGNPYPCNYNLGNIAEFTAADNVDNTAYFNYEGGYGTWNFSLNSGTLNGSASTVFSPIVAPMQGVYVHVIGSATMTLPLSGKTTSTAQPSRAKSGSMDYSPEKEIGEIRKIKLSLNYNNIVDETLVCLFDGATAGFDSDYDAFVMPEGLMPRGWTGSQINPLISTGAGTQKYAINSLPLPDPSVPLVIPVTINIKEAGSYTITVPEFENLAGTEVTLKHGAVTTKLEKGTTYKFNSLPGSYDNLALVIGPLTNINKEEMPGADVFNTWFRDELLYIKSPSGLISQKARLIIYDVQGKPVSDKNIILAPGEITNVPVSLKDGIYLSHIIADGKRFINKFVVLQ